MGAELFLALFSAVVLLPALALVVWGAVLGGRDDQQRTLAHVAKERETAVHAEVERGEL